MDSSILVELARDEPAFFIPTEFVPLRIDIEIERVMPLYFVATVRDKVVIAWS